MLMRPPVSLPIPLPQQITRCSAPTRSTRTLFLMRGDFYPQTSPVSCRVGPSPLEEKSTPHRQCSMGSSTSDRVLSCTPSTPLQVHNSGSPPLEEKFGPHRRLPT